MATSLWSYCNDPSFWLVAIVLPLILGLLIRFSFHGRTSEADEWPKQIPKIPSLIPYIRHGFYLKLKPYSYTRHMSTKYGLRCFRLQAFDKDILIVQGGDSPTAPTSRSSVISLALQPGSSDTVSWAFLSRAFVLNRQHMRTFIEAQVAARKAATSSFQSVDASKGLLEALHTSVEHDAPFLVTFSSSRVDQLPWERASSLKLQAPTQTSSESDVASKATIPLSTLIRNFTGHLLLKSLLGSDLMELYPGICEDLHELDKGFEWIVMGIPRWVPLPGHLAAHLAKRRLETAFRGLYAALSRMAAGDDPGAGWNDLSDVSEIMRARSDFYRERNLPESLRLALDVDFIMALYSQVTTLTTWLTLHICSDADLLRTIRDENTSFAKVSKSEYDFGIPSPPRLDVDINGLQDHCPTLKACYVETLRLHTYPVMVSDLSKDEVLGKFGHNEKKTSSASKSDNPRTANVTVISIPQLDERSAFQPKSMESPGSSGATTDRLDLLLRPWRGGHLEGLQPSCSADVALLFAAGLLSLWDIKLEPTSTAIRKGSIEFPAVMERPKDVHAEITRRTI